MSKDVEKLLQELSQTNKELNEALEKDKSEIVKLRQQKIEAEKKAELAKNEENKAKQEAAKAIRERQKAQEFQKGEYQALIKELFEKPQKELTSHIINESAESKRITLRTFIISLVVSLTITLLASAFSLFFSSQASLKNEEQIKKIISSQLELANKVPNVSSHYFDLNFSPKQKECVKGTSDFLNNLNASDIEPMENGSSGVKGNNRVVLTCYDNRLLSYITGTETINVKGFPSNNVNSLQKEISNEFPMLCLPLTEDFEEDFNREERWIIPKNATVGETKFGNSKSINFSGDDELRKSSNPFSSSSEDDERSIRTQKFDSSNWDTISFDLIIERENNQGENVPSVNRAPILYQTRAVVLEYSLKGESEWTEIATYYIENFQDWTTISEEISTKARAKETQFRWKYIDSFYKTTLGPWALDNINISCK